MRAKDQTRLCPPLARLNRPCPDHRPDGTDPWPDPQLDQYKRVEASNKIKTHSFHFLKQEYEYEI